MANNGLRALMDRINSTSSIEKLTTQVPLTCCDYAISLFGIKNEILTHFFIGAKFFDPVDEQPRRDTVGHNIF